MEPNSAATALPAYLRPDYPRPLLRRANYLPLDGEWDFAFDCEGCWTNPNQVQFDRRIVVPYAPETRASGIGDTGFHHVCWYRRTIPAPAFVPGQHILIHFGAVDWQADVWINGHPAGTHRGGYTPFHVEATSFVRQGDDITVVVRVEDDPHDLTKPRGKQDWQLEPHSIWYPRTTGIWQSVWMEVCPSTWIRDLRWTPNLERYEISLEAWLSGERRDGVRLNVKLTLGEKVLADDTYGVISGEVHRRIALSDPGIDDFRNELLWSPESPVLIQVELHLWGGRGELLDSVYSYTAMRTVGTQGERFMLNGRPYYQRLVLDQGYWPETGLTPPDTAALRKDIELVKAMGFNGVRKHQKVEDPRFLYWADVLGLLVWEEMPSAYRFTKHSVDRLTREWGAVIDRDISHPCIVTWVPFNESWGVPDLPSMESQRNYVQALYHLTRTLDPTRPVVGNDGWESVATDIIGIHDYESDTRRIARRYESTDPVPQLLQRVGPAGRLLTLEGHEHRGQPIVLSEFGGIAYTAPAEDNRTWGYSRAESTREFGRRYAELLNTINCIALLAGFCYTQLTDTYQEANGLLYADRTPKLPLTDIRAATTGRHPETGERLSNCA